MMPTIWLGLFLILHSVKCQNHLRPENRQMPGWISARTSTKSTAKNNCQYSCSEGGGCTVIFILLLILLFSPLSQVQFRGYILGKCDPSGVCVGTPHECEDCREVIQCEKTSATLSLSKLVCSTDIDSVLLFPGPAEDVILCEVAANPPPTEIAWTRDVSLNWEEI